MTARASVTVAVLNHRRPHLLARVLTGVMQLDHPAFEVVVVGDRPALADYRLPTRLARAVRYARCAEANICRARNLAVAQAAGEIVAFVDDDAVPEPDWLNRLTAPFADPTVGAAGGVVRAAGGQSLEWAGGRFDRAGTEYPPDENPSGERAAPVAAVTVLSAGDQRADGRWLSFRGVNSAWRRAAVLAAGGFDEAFRYYLDETDMALRLSDAGWSAVMVPEAEVHHLPEQNAARGSLRQPRDLFEVAASKAHFCRRHLPADRVEPEIAAFRAVRLRALDTHLRLGLLRRADRERLARRFDQGVEDGLARASVLPLSAGCRARTFAPAPRPLRLSIAIATGWGPLAVARLRGMARRLAGAGHAVSCFSYLSGPQAPSVEYRHGVWLHRGGTWRIDAAADGRPVIGRGALARAEIARMGARRRFDIVLRPAAGDSSGAALLPVAGLSRPLEIRPAGDCAMDLAEIVIELRRVLEQPLPPPGDAADHPPVVLPALEPGRTAG